MKASPRPPTETARRVSVGQGNAFRRTLCNWLSANCDEDVLDESDDALMEHLAHRLDLGGYRSTVENALSF